MLPNRQFGAGTPALVLMPFLSGSGREFGPLIELLAPSYRCVAVDLPGFGDASAVPGYTVEEMVDALISTLLDLQPAIGSFVLVGHSMAGKVSAVLARMMADGKTELQGLAGLVLVAPSPPGPEPIGEQKRAEMLESLGQPHPDQRLRAEKFIDDNLAHRLPAEVYESHVEDVLRMNVAAWNAWLEHGSHEDWADRVGVLDLPTLIVAGESDGPLGPAAQMLLTLPHFSQGQVRAIDANHLIPTERPAELAALIHEFLSEIAPGVPTASSTHASATAL